MLQCSCGDMQSHSLKSRMKTGMVELSLARRERPLDWDPTSSLSPPFSSFSLFSSSSQQASVASDVVTTTIGVGGGGGTKCPLTPTTSRYESDRDTAKDRRSVFTHDGAMVAGATRDSGCVCYICAVRNVPAHYWAQFTLLVPVAHAWLTCLDRDPKSVIAIACACAPALQNGTAGAVLALSCCVVKHAATRQYMRTNEHAVSVVNAREMQRPHTVQGHSVMFSASTESGVPLEGCAALTQTHVVRLALTDTNDNSFIACYV